MNTEALNNVIALKTLFGSPIGEQSIIKNVPIELLEKTQEAFLRSGIRVRVAFRGPRTVQVGVVYPPMSGTSQPSMRTRRQARSWCLKAYAKTFAVYYTA